MRRPKLFIFILIALISSINASAQNLIEIQYSRPALNQLRADDLWKFTLKNTSNEDLEFSLFGTLTESKAGLIATGQTMPIKLKKGESRQFKVSDLPQTPDINYVHSDQRYKEALMRAGNLPDGEYTICVTAKQTGTNDDIGNECIEQVIQKETEGEISLLTPGNNEQVAPDSPLIFSWMAIGDAGSYKIKIVEITGDESAENAMLKNKAFFEKEDIRMTTFQYPSSAPKFKNGVKYVWMIEAGKMKSNVWMFMMTTYYTPLVLSDFTPVCDPIVKNKYNFTLKLTNMNPSAGGGPSANAVITAISAIPPSAAGTNIAFNSPFLMNTTLFPYNSAIVITGSIITTNPSLVKMNISIKDQNFGSQLQYQTDGNYNLVLPRCSCCEGFTRKIEDIKISDNGKRPVFSAGLIAGPNPIIKVTAEMVYFYQNWSKPMCNKCVTSTMLTGNFTGGNLNGFGAGQLASAPLTASYSREVAFSSAAPGVFMTTPQPIELNMALPPASQLKCCSDTIRLCIRFSFTDSACVTCDTVVCRKIIRTSTGITISASGSSDKHSDETSKNKLSEITKTSYETISENLKKVTDKNHIQETSDTLEKLDLYNMETFDKQMVLNAIQRSPSESLSMDEQLKFYENVFNEYQTIKKHPELRYILPNNTVAACDNGGFENGLAGYSGAYGYNDYTTVNFGPTYYKNNNGILISSSLPISITNIYGTYSVLHSVETMTPGPDANVPSLNKVKTGNSSVRINNSSTLYGTDVLAKKFTVDNTSSIFRFWYALVLENPINHPWEQQPFFLVRVKKSNGSIIPNINFLKVADGNDPFFENAPGNIVYREWSCGSLDLSSLMGEEVTVEFMVADCAQGGHYGYAYIDDICTSCAGSPDGYGSINCCDNFETKITSSVRQLDPNNPFIYEVKSNIKAGPNRIKKVRAFLSYFEKKTSNPDCDTCLGMPTLYGSLWPELKFGTPCPSPIPGLSCHIASMTTGGAFTDGNNLRELVWGGDNSPGTNLNTSSGIDLKLTVIVPPPSSITCCADTIDFCIKYTFTDTTCLTCDTVICSRIIRKPPTRLPNSNPREQFKKLEQDFRKQFEEMEKRKLDKKGSSDLFEPDSEDRLTYSTEPVQNQDIGGQAAGIINMEITKNTRMKITVYDLHGKEVMKVFDDFIKTGQYSFDLNSLELPDGEYYYKSEYNNKTEYNKVIISKTVTSNCGCKK
ncbi:MAG TPA: T9SS type A sorting domain-containing protein [Ignavibacteria bacterium]|nr:T9SS type A sorting domain-containing protein [Ignavibacteria bacterium]